MCKYAHVALVRFNITATQEDVCNVHVCDEVSERGDTLVAGQQTLFLLLDAFRLLCDVYAE